LAEGWAISHKQIAVCAAFENRYDQTGLNPLAEVEQAEDTTKAYLTITKIYCHSNA